MSDALTPSEWRDIIEGENEDGIELAHAVRLAQAGRPMACAQVALYNQPFGFDDFSAVGDPANTGTIIQVLRRAAQGSPDAAMLAELMRRIEALQVPG